VEECVIYRFFQVQMNDNSLNALLCSAFLFFLLKFGIIIFFSSSILP
jgi:hypothetical protein